MNSNYKEGKISKHSTNLLITIMCIARIDFKESSYTFDYHRQFRNTGFLNIRIIFLYLESKTQIICQDLNNLSRIIYNSKF